MPSNGKPLLKPTHLPFVPLDLNRLATGETSLLTRLGSKRKEKRKRRSKNLCMLSLSRYDHKFNSVLGLLRPIRF